MDVFTSLFQLAFYLKGKSKKVLSAVATSSEAFCRVEKIVSSIYFVHVYLHVVNIFHMA